MIIKVNYTVSDIYMSTSVSPVYIKVVYSGTSSGGGTWGTITGTLSNQTDLQDALDDKIPYTGATGAVSLGLYGLTAGSLTLQPQALNSDTYKITQQMASNDYWSIYGYATIADYGDLYFELQDNAAFADGQRFRFHYGNASSGTPKDILLMDYNSATIDGTLQVNNLAGSGTRMVVSDANGALSTQSIPSTSGFVPYTGATGDVNLGTHRILAQNATISSSGSGDTFLLNHSSGSGIGLNITKGGNGEGLYVNKTGGSGNAATIIGTLNATNLVKSGGTSAQLLAADGSVVTAGTNITISGGTISASGGGAGMAIGGAITSATAGSVLFAGTSGVLAQDNANFFWDDANNRLGIGTNTPSATLQVNNSVLGDNFLVNGALSSSLKFSTDSFGRVVINVSSDPLSTAQGGAYFTATGYEESWFNVVARVASTGNKYWRFGNFGTGNYFGIQKLNDAGTSIVSTPFQINSSTGSITVLNSSLFQDNINLTKNQNAGTILTITNTTSGTAASSTINLISQSNTVLSVIKNSSATNAYKISTAGDGVIYNGSSGDIAILNDFSTGKIKLAAGGSSTAQATLTAAGRLLLGTTTESTFLLDVNGTARVTSNLFVSGSIRTNSITLTDSGSPLVISGGTTQGSIVTFGNSGVQHNYTSGSVGIFTIGSPIAYAPTSGNGVFNTISLSPTINQTGGASGVTRGLYVNPTLTAAADWRAIESSTGGAYFNTTSVAASAILQADSTTKGFLPPRMTNAQRTAISSPAIGLVVYCTDATEGLYQYINNAWVNLTGIVTNRQTASYTLALGDSNDLVEMNVASANNLTIPLNSSVAFPIGTKIDVTQYGAGQTTIVATGGVTIRSANGWLKLNAQYAAASLIKIATDEWYLFGNLNA